MAKDIGHEGPYDFDKGYGTGVPTVGQEKELTPVFSYEYIDLGITPYHFHVEDEDFTADDRKVYFSKLKEYSGLTLDELMDLPKKEHFVIDVNPDAKVLSLVEEVYGKKLKTNDKPIIGHFQLYTTPVQFDTQNQRIRNKSPRVFFHLDTGCVFHILFYDPYHEINEMGQQTKNSLLKQK